MKSFLAFVSLLTVASLGFANDAIDVVDNTKSVIVSNTTENTGAVSTATASTNCVCKSACNCSSQTLTYTHKNKIAPCATQREASLCFCESGVDACCNKVTQRVNVEVPICAPACPSKETVRRSRDGKRAVYDYGRYEVVLRADEDGDVNVKYRKRLLDR